MAEERTRIFLLDASTYIFRAFHSTQPRDGSRGFTNSRGLPTNALLVFTNMIRKLVREQKCTHFAAVFDHSDKSFRNDRYDLYKANRKETPDDLKLQFPYFRPIVEGLGLTPIEKPGFEADDVIATLATQAKAAGWDAVIVSSDKDLYQLMNDHVHVFDTMKDVWIDLEIVDKKFGVTPDLVQEVQGLIGDPVDNIPGVPGVGPKTASKLINEYGSLEGLYAHIDALKGKLKENLVNYRDDAFMSRELATLISDVELDKAVSDMAVRDADNVALTTLFTELEFKSLLREYYVDTRVREASERRTVSNGDELRELADALSACPRFAIDAVTVGDRILQSHVVGLSFATGPCQSWYLPVGHRYLGAPPQVSMEQATAALKELLGEEGRAKSAHASKELSIILNNHGITLRGVTLDTEIGSFLANATKYAHTLDNLALDRLAIKLPTPSKAIERGKERWSEAAVETAAEYAQARAEAIFQCAAEIEGELDDAGISHLNGPLELPLGRVLATMEMTGIRIDPEVLHALSDQFARKMSEVEKIAFEMVGREFNMGSPKQLADVLFNRLGLPVIKKTKTGASTNAAVLEQLMDKHPIIAMIMDWREVQKLKSTYTDVLPTLINPQTGRVHTNFKQAVAATGRLSSLNPNLQNIPIRSETGRRIRAAFIADEGCQLVCADYSQVELRLLAHFSADPGLTEAFCSGVDVHTRTASEIFGIPEAEVTRTHRGAAKAINFGLMYGMGAFRLSQDQHISRREAQEYIDRYFERYSSVKAFMDGCVEFGKTHGFVETLLGRRRYIAELDARNPMRRSAAERIAINTPVQGSAADIIKLAMLKVDERLRREGLATRMLLQVHDELVFDVPENEVEQIKALVVEEMENAYELSVPLTVHCSSGYNWFEAH
jgi:DNA polymerase-1